MDDDQFVKAMRLFYQVVRNVIIPILEPMPGDFLVRVVIYVKRYRFSDGLVRVCECDESASARRSG
jgi:hypothetical protein